MSEKKINILYINSTAKMSGAEFSLLSLLEGLERSKYQPFLLVPEKGPLSDKVKKLGMKIFIMPDMIKYGEGHQLYKLPRIIKSLFNIRALIKKNHINLVHSNSPRTAYLGAAAARLSKVSTVTHVRDIYQSPFARPLKARLLSILSDKIIAVSSATKNSIITTLPSLEPKIKVVYNGVDIKSMENYPVHNFREEFHLGHSDPLIGCIGLINPVKGQEILIRASAVLKKTFPSLKVVIVGDILLKDEKLHIDELKRLVLDLGLERNVIFTGFRNDVFSVIRSLDIVIHPSVYPEPFPRNLLEAAALKKTIVATKVGGMPEMLKNGESALLIEPADPEALANAVTCLLNDRKLSQKLASGARLRIEKCFTLERHTKNIMAVYDQLPGWCR